MTTTSRAPSSTAASVSWGNDRVLLRFVWDDDLPVRLDAVTVEGRVLALHEVPAVEILAVGAGHEPASSRLIHTRVGERLRYVDHDEDADARALRVVQSDGELVAVLELSSPPGSAAIRAQVTVTNVGDARVVLRAVPSWSSGFTPAGHGGDRFGDWHRTTGISDWLGEGRWQRTPLRGPDFVPLGEELTGHNPRGALSATSDGTWSTGHHLPTVLLDSATVGVAVGWQIEHNGAWRWELGEDTDGGYFALSGPTDQDSGWTHVLAPGAAFTTVPVTLAWGDDWRDVVDELTDARRAGRRAHPDNSAMAVVFNDYMNTLDGDPTTEKLLPLIAAAAEVGAEIFCVDAGWYDDSGHWWDTVGEWRPSASRFPGGFHEVLDAIRDAGMTPGLWLEPEVVGFLSPLAHSLPVEAFLQRGGERVVEHDRFHLDLRHPAARAHLDEVIDRVVGEYGVGFIKMDYNINPGPGTDRDADSVGDGLLGHNRAHLAWLDAVLDRHPQLVVENCSSGAMRMDYAMLSRLAMQSTSDQQDFTKYPPIAAAAPLSMAPEQAASWAYPQPSMTEEEAAFALVTGLLGRFYVSGHLNEMSPPQRDQVAQAIRVAKTLRGDIAAGHPFWPLGLPGWADEWIALGLTTPTSDLVSVWKRGSSTGARLELPHRRGTDLDVTVEFPTDLPAWSTVWDAGAGVLTVHADSSGIAARTFRLAARSA